MTAIITWITYTNYGTFLQAYALQKKLAELGVQSRIIGDARFTHLKTSLKHIIALILKMPIHFKQNYIRLKNNCIHQIPFRIFEKRHLKVDRGWKHLSQLDKIYTGYICGSDQIWSPLLPDDHDGFYFAAFSDNPKIAYSPSIGVTKVCKGNWSERVKPWLDDFSFISIRESIGAKIIGEIVGNRIETTLDPTLLLNREEWDSIAGRKRKSNPYYIAYFLTFNKQYVEHAQLFAKTKGKRLIIIGTDVRLKAYSDKFIINTSPSEFLRLIRDSEFVMTDSFHGTIFSIIFRRQFVTFQRFKDEVNENQNSRINNLFDIFGIQQGMTNEDDLKQGKFHVVKDFDDIHKRLVTERNRSFSILKYATTFL